MQNYSIDKHKLNILANLFRLKIERIFFVDCIHDQFFRSSVVKILI